MSLTRQLQRSSRSHSHHLIETASKKLCLTAHKAKSENEKGTKKQSRVNNNNNNTQNGCTLIVVLVCNFARVYVHADNMN